MTLILLVAIAAIAGVSTMFVGWPKDEPLPSARAEIGVMFVIAALGLLALAMFT